MSAKRSNGSAAPSVQKWVINSDVEKQFRTALYWRLKNESLSIGSIELYLRYPNLTAIGWGEPSDNTRPLGRQKSLLRIDLSGCPKLESIPEAAFSGSSHLVSAVFGEHSNITKLGWEALGNCSALTSIILPNKLEVIENLAFENCTSLERVVFNKNLETIDEYAFVGCSKLEDVQLASSSISFGSVPFGGCNRLIELTDAAGFPSIPGTGFDGVVCNKGDGVVPYLLDRFERSERKGYVLVALMRFNEVVHTHEGSEEDKVAAAKKLHPEVRKGKKRKNTSTKTDYNKDEILAGAMLHKMGLEGGGVKGMLGEILSFV